jgi:hypothetical protein
MQGKEISATAFQNSKYLLAALCSLQVPEL